MRVAIFSREFSWTAAKTIEYFSSMGCAICLVVIETGIRQKFSETERAFAAAHMEFSRILLERAKPSPPPAGPIRFLWSRVPAGAKAPIRRILGRGTDDPESPPRVENYARGHRIPVARVERHSSEATKAILETNGIDLVLLVKSAWLVKEPLLSMKWTKVINIHQALLPNHRSLDSLPWSLIEGDKIGHTAHFVDAGIDTGPVLLFREVPLRQRDTLLTMRGRIEGLRPVLFHAAVAGLADGSIVPKPQKPSNGVHHRPMTVAELLMAEDALQKRLVKLREASVEGKEFPGQGAGSAGHTGGTGRTES